LRTRPFFHILIVLVTAAFSSCDTRRVYEENKEIPEHTWSNKNIVPFTVDIKDTLSLHNVYINIRNAGDYTYSNIYLFLNTSYPDGKMSRDTVECILADNNGRWLGKGSGDVWDNQVLFKRGVRFKQAGIYKFTYEQAMRVESLPQIMDVGLRIEKQ
jgi:gliding motility-associated lipoprotein GldH